MAIASNFVPLPQDGNNQFWKGANMDPGTWTVKQMSNPPTKFKIVDNSVPEPINVADMFDSEVTAQQFIDHYKWRKDNPCPNGKIHDPMTGECITPTRELPPSGVLQIYQNNPRIPIWVLGFDNWKVRATDTNNVSGTGRDAIYKKSGQVRFSVKCKQGAGDGSNNHKLNLQRGYSDSPDDFVNIEQTGYIDITNLASSSSDQDVTWYGPTGRHTDNGGANKCMGSTYKGSLHAKEGKNRMAKENWHVNMTFLPWQDGPAGVKNIIKQMNEQSKRVGFKWVNYRVGNYRRREIWVDIGGAIGYNENPKNKWQLVRLHEDRSDFGDDIKDCGCDNDKQAILWGAPSCTYRWDNQTGKLSLATVQEIYPPTTFYNVGDIVEANPSS